MSTLNTTNLKHPSATGNNIVLAADGGATFQQIQGGSLTLATAQTASGTAVDFTGIPSWVKRITVMFSGVSTNGTSALQIRIGDSTGIVSTGYASSGGFIQQSTTFAGVANATSGFQISTNFAATNSLSGIASISLLSGNVWCATGTFTTQASTPSGAFTAGSKTLSGTLDRIRITTVNGTDTFDAGSINILYEG
jgi:hypothetical protein